MRADARRCLDDTWRALLVLVALATPAGLVAHAQHDPTRRGFAHLPHTVQQMILILHANVAHGWGPVLFMAGLVQARRVFSAPASQRAFVVCFDLAVVVIALYTFALPTGQVLGAYGWRGLRSTLPAGPIELLAYALAGSIYLHSRRTLICVAHVRYVAGIAASSAAALLAAALLESLL